MKVLIVYATTEGQTRKIAEHVASRAGDLSHDVVVCDSGTGKVFHALHVGDGEDGKSRVA